MWAGFTTDALALALLAVLGPLPAAIHWMLVLCALAGAGYLVGCLALDGLPRPGRAAVAAIWAIFIAVRAVLLVGTEPLSDDVVGYQWHGYTQTHGHNPYARTPGDPAYRDLMKAFPHRVPHAGARTPYPPLAQIVFRWVWPVGLGALGMRLVFTLFDLAAAAVLWSLMAGRAGRGDRAVWYLANPLVIFAFACDGHLDSLGLVCLAGGLWLLDRHRARGALVALGAGIAAKIAPVLLVPYWLRHTGWRRAWLVLVVPVASGALYVGAATTMFDGLGFFARMAEFNGSAYQVSKWLFGDDKLHAVVLVGALFALALWVVWLRRLEPERASLAVLFALCLASRVVHPWYVTWLVVFLPMRRSWPVVLWSLTAPATYYIYGAYDPDVAGSWQESPWVLWVQYAPVYAALAWSAWRWATSPTPDDPQPSASIGGTPTAP